MLHVSTLSIKPTWEANLSYGVLVFSKKGVFNAYFRNTFNYWLSARMTKIMLDIVHTTELSFFDCVHILACAHTHAFNMSLCLHVVRCYEVGYFC